MPRKLRAKTETLPGRKAEFIDPMECLQVSVLPDGPNWIFEIKLDGYRAIAVKSESSVTLYSRNQKSLNNKFPYIAEALRDLPVGTVIDGELVALDDHGRPEFNLLQNFKSEAARIRFFAFDILCFEGRDLTKLSLLERKDFLTKIVTNDRFRVSEHMEVLAKTMLGAIKEQGLEGVVAKRKDSVYEAGERTGAWVKMRVNEGQEFVIGGYIPGPYGLDSIVIGFYRDDELIYVARVRNGFVPASRRAVYNKIKGFAVTDCPFANLPETGRSRWGDPMDLEKMKKCVWVRPQAVAQISFLEWTGKDHLRHSKFVGLREDKKARLVRKEAPPEP
jgi:DNA ligase D-like protein (predicted ligase)